MIVAHLAGIDTFATGGIGGVHRGAETSFDISADLQELAQTPVTVVAAGPKAILDIPKTLEVLETLGVPVIAFGQDEVPAFWSRASGLTRSAPHGRGRRDRGRRPDARRASGCPADSWSPIRSRPRLKSPAKPLPRSSNRPCPRPKTQGIAAKDVTPFLLQRIYELTEGRSLTANIALVLNNARLAAQIAREFVLQREK